MDEEKQRKLKKEKEKEKRETIGRTEEIQGEKKKKKD